MSEVNKDLTYSEAMIEMCTFVSDMAKSEDIPERIKEQAKKVLGNFLFASVMNVVKKDKPE